MGQKQSEIQKRKRKIKMEEEVKTPEIDQQTQPIAFT